jgi:ribosomal protein S18 acetylase RimI-like enzyme
MFNICTYHEHHWRDLYRICLETGDSGADATMLYKHPDLLGHFYAAPYALFEPELTFMLEDEQGACGYILATANSELFAQRMETQWLPPLRLEFPLPNPQDLSRDTSMIRVIHKGYQADPQICLEYPAHLHIDLLQRAQKKGQGKRLMETLFTALRSQGVAGVHLGVGSRNENGIAFYEHIGFKLLQTHPWGRVYGYLL